MYIKSWLIFLYKQKLQLFFASLRFLAVSPIASLHDGEGILQIEEHGGKGEHFNVPKHSVDSGLDFVQPFNFKILTQI